MRPLKLTAEGLRSIRKPVEVDFTGRDNIAIIGDTGAGKSSLLQAITYALYGRPTYSGQANQELMNDTAAQLRVVLEFVVAGERYKVARTLRRAGDGRVMPGSAVLMRLDDDDNAIEQVEQVRPVNERLEELLGLDFDAFTRTVLLPQGEFAKLLVDDRPTARSAILQQIWRTDELTALGEAARELSSELAPLLARVEQQLEGEPADPGAHSAELTARREAASAAAEQARIDHAEAVQAAAALDVARTHHAAARSVTEALTGDAVGEHPDAATALAATASQLTGDREELQETLTRLRGELAKVPDDVDGLDAGGIATARDRLERLPELAETHNEARAEQRSLATEAGTAREEARQSHAEAGRLREQAQERAPGRERLLEDKKSADASLHTATITLADGRSVAKAAAGKQTEARQLTSQAEDEAEQAQAAEQRAEDLAGPVEELTELLEVRRRAEAAAAAAHGLHAGEGCPVCEQELPDDWHPPAGSGDLESTAAALAQAREEETQARAAAVRIRGKAEATDRAAKEARGRAEELERTATARIAELSELVGVPAAGLDLGADDERLLEPLAERCQAAVEAVGAYDTETSELDRQAGTAETSAGTASQRAEELEARSRAAGERAGSALTRLRKSLAQLPEGLVDLALPDDSDMALVELPDLAPAHSSLEERDRLLAERTSARRELQEKMGEREIQLGTLEQQLESRVHAPARVLAAKLDAHRDELLAASSRLAAADAAPELTLPGLAAACSAADLPQLVAASMQATDVLLTAAAALESAARSRGGSAREVTDRLAGLVDLPDGREADALVRLLDERHRELDHVARTAQRGAEAFEQRIAPLRELARAKDELAQVCSLVADLAQALQPSRFPKWLTLRRSRTLLVYASKLLGEMTAGRYAFADLDDEASEWRIIDADSGMPRSPQSLSGGEQFIASLALALGIVEMMARSGGRLESLWLDEGFGALDRSNLDLAVQALASVSAGGRMVAVITHVQAVAEQVEHVLAVTRTPTGTEVDWLSAAQRLDAADGELTEELSGAVGGLLS